MPTGKCWLRIPVCGSRCSWPHSAEFDATQGGAVEEEGALACERPRAHDGAARRCVNVRVRVLRLADDDCVRRGREPEGVVEGPVERLDGEGDWREVRLLQDRARHLQQGRGAG
jgi:hypothetical protein